MKEPQESIVGLVLVVLNVILLVVLFAGLEQR